MSSILSFDDLFGTSPFFLGEEASVADGLENYADYVDSQSSHLDFNEFCSASEEREQAPVYEELCDFTVSNDYSGSTLPSPCRKKEHKGRAIKLKEEKLDLQCGWRDCDYCTSNIDHFVCHVSFHLPHLGVKLNENQEGTGSVQCSMLIYVTFIIVTLVNVEQVTSLTYHFQSCWTHARWIELHQQYLK
jgi:hypothetical protein